jgi:hypothetical protein
MNKIFVAALLLGTSSFAMAQSTTPKYTPRHEMKYTPRHEMKNAKVHNPGPGASYLSPGHQIQRHTTVGVSRGTTKGASEYTPHENALEAKSRR